MKHIDQIRNDIKTAIKVREKGGNMVIGILGMPGVGKTQMVHSVCDELGYEMWAGFNISAASPMDVAIKVPNIEEGIFETLPSDDFPWESLAGDRKILLFIDECTNGTSDTIKAIQRLINERRLGKHVLGKNVIMVLAGNRQSDKAGSGNLSTAMYNRVTWRNWEWSAKHCADVIDYLQDKYPAGDNTGAKDAHAMFAGYFGHKPILESDFTDAVKQLGKAPYVQWCSPRSLESLLCRIEANEWQLPDIADTAGDIGMGRATELANFKTILSKLEKYDKVVEAPEEAKLADSPESKYAMYSMLAARVNKKDFTPVWEYVTREKEVTFRILFLRLATKMNPEIRESKSYAALFGTDKELASVMASI